MRVHTNIIMDQELLDELKIVAIQKHTTISKIISNVVSDYLEQIKNQ